MRPLARAPVLRRHPSADRLHGAVGTRGAGDERRRGPAAGRAGRMTATRRLREVALPSPRGPWTASLLGLLLEDSQGSPEVDTEVPPGLPDAVLEDDDLQLALYLCYELHYAELVGVAPEMEWDPLVLMLRGAMEQRFEQALRSLV